VQTLALHTWPTGQSTSLLQAGLLAEQAPSMQLCPAGHDAPSSICPSWSSSSPLHASALGPSAAHRLFWQTCPAGQSALLLHPAGGVPWQRPPWQNWPAGQSASLPQSAGGDALHAPSLQYSPAGQSASLAQAAGGGAQETSWQN
jgi:hypothetical protein